MYTYGLSLKFNQNESQLADKASLNYSPYQEPYLIYTDSQSPFI